MPGQRAEGVRLHNIGVDDTLWAAAKAKATRNLTISEVVREALKAWLGHPDARYDLFTPPPAGQR